MAVLLPDEIVVWEILVRLPPKALLRCRAVCRAWRRATSARRFLVAHHGRQPTLPLLRGLGRDFLDIIPFDHRTGLAAAAADQLQPVARLEPVFIMESCGGLLLLCDHRRRYAICNPATREYAPLRQADGFKALGMYPHRPTGEYRLLLYPERMLDDGPPYPDNLMEARLSPGIQDGCHVFTLGSSLLPPRNIGWPEARVLVFEKNVLLRGSLHWYPFMQPESGVIMVYDTATESFRHMRAPFLPDNDELFEIDGMLGMSSFNDTTTEIGIWVLQDYESEVWTFKCLIQLPDEQIRAQFQQLDTTWDVLVTSSDGDLLVLVQFGKRLLQFDVDGKLVTTFHRKGLCRDSLRLKQSLVLHTFFPAIEGYVVNNSPFLSTSQGC